MNISRYIPSLRSRRYETIAVIDGAIIMMLEIVGARIIAPYFGNSIYVWTAVIGVILGALSVGYWYGGRLADRMASDRGLSIILLGAAGVLLVSMLVREPMLQLVAVLGTDVRVQAFVASIILFGPANVLMGMVSPYLAKLKITTLSTTGSSVGGLYAAGTIGSIIGTFAAGYWLIAIFGNRVLSLLLVLGLVGSSFIAWRGSVVWQRLLLVAITVMLFFWPGFRAVANDHVRVAYDGDSSYARLQVLDSGVGVDAMRYLVTDNAGAQSGVYLNRPEEPAFKYIERFVQVAESIEPPRRVLLIGGGAYTLPHLLLDRYPKAQIDVVEIDPKLKDLAIEYFSFKEDPRIRVINQDGRTFLNNNKIKYDLIYMDAFSSLSPPHQLTTSEAVKRIMESLSSDGVVAVNIISAYSGVRSGFARVEYATYLRHFEAVSVTPVYAGMPGDIPQNMIMLASQNSSITQKAAAGFAVPEAPILPADWILTDDFAPVEQLTAIH